MIKTFGLLVAVNLMVDVSDANEFSPLPVYYDCVLKIFGQFDVSNDSGESLDSVPDVNALVTKIGGAKYLNLLHENQNWLLVGQLEEGKSVELFGKTVTFYRDSENLFWFFDSIQQSEEAVFVTTGRLGCIER